MNEEMDAAMNEFAEEVAAPLRAPVHITEGFQSRTMAAIRRADKFEAPLLPEPRSIRVTPMSVLTLAAVLIAVALGSAALGRNSVRTPGAVSNVASAPVVSADTIHLVRFQLAAPGAHSVALVGDFNDWARNAIVLQPAEKPGVWTASVPLTKGRHEYAFIVDGKRWVPDPYALTHRDEYDVESSVIRVGESGT